MLRALTLLLALLMLLLAAVFACVSTIGVPQPLLRKVLENANGAGIPIDIGRIRYTPNGWIGDEVRYYSLNPADTDPMSQARTVRFTRQASEHPHPSHRWAYDIEAQGVEIAPSVEWGVAIPSVPIATNVMQRLKFNGEQAPGGHIRLGSCVTNWSTFFIDVALTGT